MVWVNIANWGCVTQCWFPALDATDRWCAWSHVQWQTILFAHATPAIYRSCRFVAQVSLIHGRNVDGVSCIQLAEWSQALQIRWLRTCSRAAVILRMANGPQVNGQRCGSTQHTLCHKQNTENIRHKSEQQWRVENKKKINKYIKHVALKWGSLPCNLISRSF